MKTHRWQDVKDESLSEAQQARVRARVGALERPPIVRSWTYWAVVHVPGFWRLAAWWSRIGRRFGLSHPIGLSVIACPDCGGAHGRGSIACKVANDAIAAWIPKPCEFCGETHGGVCPVKRWLDARERTP